MKYQALIVDDINGNYELELRTVEADQFLPPGDVLIRVHYSSLNYKDALSATGNKGVTKKYPHTPGIDAAGVVEKSDSPNFQPGQQVIVSGFDLGMNTPGGMGQLIRVPATWVVALPEELSMKEAMILGTAGFTAAVSVLRLSEKVGPTAGPVLVSGATGGVGSLAVAMLHKKGYEVHAISGKDTEHDFLYSMGASTIYPRSDFQELNPKPLLPGRFAGAIDTVGGEILVNILKSTQPNGLVTTCGSVSSVELNLNVFPFILRAVSLVGISAQNYPAELRPELWGLMAKTYKPLQLNEIYNEISLTEVSTAVDKILKGQLKGRTIIRVIDE
jgi:acrylyl-CoA reductase (NADPH)